MAETPTPITLAQLHDPILPHVRPAALIVQADDTIGHALERARALPDTQIILYCYVVDDQDRLAGIVPIRRLLTNPVEARVSDIMIQDVVAIPSWATVLVAAEYFVNRRLLAFPVVEQSGKLVGLVDVTLFTDDVLALARQSFEGIFQLLGIHATKSLTAWSGYKDRFPWLLCNVAGGLLCAFLLSHFEHLLKAAVVLALFIPALLALAESVSIQTVTLTLQSLQSGRFDSGAFLRDLSKEAATAVLLGVSCGALVGLAAWGWQRNLFVAGALAGAIAASMLTACLFGVALPTLLRALKADPKIAAGPIVLALTDLATLLFYFTVAGTLL
jgi:magnesium transporter